MLPRGETVFVFAAPRCLADVIDPKLVLTTPTTNLTVGQTATLLVTYKDPFNNPIQNADIHISITGPNAGSPVAALASNNLTNSNGPVFFDYQGLNAGTDAVYAFTSFLSPSVFDSGTLHITWTSPVPEPSTMLLFGCGCCALGGLRGLRRPTPGFLKED